MISLGLDTLRSMATDMNTELDKQTDLIHGIENRVDEVSAEIRTQNAKIKKIITNVRIIFFLIGYLIIFVFYFQFYSSVIPERLVHSTIFFLFQSAFDPFIASVSKQSISH